MADILLDHILPKNATVWERVLGSNVDRLLDLDAERIRALWNPWTCPIEDLPYLAWALSVDVWDADWPEARKRLVCASALKDHRLKGTLGAVERYLGYHDITITNAILPPSRVFAVRAMTDADREAWIARLPQIRIYPFVTLRETPPRRGFMTGPAGHRTFFRRDKGTGASTGPASFMQISEGPKLYGRRATFQANGLPEVQATVEEFSDLGQAPAEQVMIDFAGSKRDFYGHTFMGSSHMRSTRARENVVRVRVDDNAPAQFIANSGLGLQSVRPVRVNQVRQAPEARFFIGRDFMGSGRTFMKQTYGPRLVYDRFALLDPTIEPTLKHGRSFMGHARFGLQPFTAELRLELPMTRPRWRMGVGRGSFLSGFMKKADLSSLERARQAITTAQGLTDTVLVDPENYREVRLGDGNKLGSFKLGQIMRRRK